MPTDLSPPGTRHAAGSASRKCHADQIAKTEAIRQKMLRLAQHKYLFRVQDRTVSTGLLVEDGRLMGLKVAETRVEGRKAEPVAGSDYELRASMIISSIG